MTEAIRVLAHRKELRRAQSKRRRDKLRAKRLCINGARHGKAVARHRCRWCNFVDAHGLATVLRLESEGKAPPRPPIYKPKPRRTDEEIRMAAIEEDDDDDEL